MYVAWTRNKALEFMEERWHWRNLHQSMKVFYVRRITLRRKAKNSFGALTRDVVYESMLA